MHPPRLAVMLSGNGSTLQNLIDRTADGRLAASIVGVVSSRADAFGLERAARAGIPTAVERTKPFDRIRGWQPDLVILAGWIHLLQIPADFKMKVLNVHPSLLPAFGGKGMYGRHVHAAVLAAGVKVSGCTVHFVDDEYDSGPIVHQQVVHVLDADTPDTLAARVQAAECDAYPEAIRRVAAGDWTLDGRRVRFA